MTRPARRAGGLAELAIGVRHTLGGSDAEPAGSVVLEGLADLLAPRPVSGSPVDERDLGAQRSAIQLDGLVVGRERPRP
jgi:hypothetical protein